MYLTLHFILSHLIADYVAQPSKLVKYKYKSFLGVLLHTFIHLAIILVLTFPFLHLYRVCVGALVIFATHILIDYSKIRIEKKYPKVSKFLIYISDQAAHMIVILLTAIFIGSVTPGFPGWWVELYSDRVLIYFMVILILTTYFWDVTRWVYINSKKPIPYKRDYEMICRNGLIVLIIFVAYCLTK